MSRAVVVESEDGTFVKEAFLPRLMQVRHSKSAQLDSRTGHSSARLQDRDRIEACWDQTRPRGASEDEGAGRSEQSAYLEIPCTNQQDNDDGEGDARRGGWEEGREERV
jgi:hypothetical protein